MLKKLLKYEFKATGRIMLLICLAVLAVSAVTGFLGRVSEWSSAIRSPVLFFIFITVYTILVIAMIALTVFMVIARFYRNILRGEGYLMHTLPVPTWMLIVSKLIVAFVWEMLVVAVLFVSLLIAFAFGGVWSWVADILFGREILDFLSNYAGLTVLLIITVLVQTVRMILLFYVSLSIGCSATRHKIAYSFLAFVVIVIILNVVNAVGSMGTMLDTVVSGMMMNNSDMYVRSTAAGLLTGQLVTELIFSVIFFLVTHYFLKKKLNLQ